MAIEFYITFFTFSFLNILFTLRLNVTSLVLNKQVENNICKLRLDFSPTLKANYCNQLYYQLFKN
jgi:hypothetical protein